MVTIKCETPQTVKLVALRAFQGDLKKRTSADIENLSDSIKNDGLLMPFVIWGENMLLDGHARMEALIRMAIEDPSILEQAFPVLIIEAETEVEARQILLQISSQYGKVTKAGLSHFIAKVPAMKYDSPIAIKVLGLAPKPVKPKAETGPLHTFIKLKVKTEMKQRIIEILRNVDGVEVL